MLKDEVVLLKDRVLKTEDFGVLVWATITITIDWWLNQQLFISHRSGGWMSGIRVGSMVRFLLRALCLVYRGLLVLAVSSHGRKS